jgi:hypothetical protein
MDVPGEQEAARVVEELREFVRGCDCVKVQPGSRLAHERALARLAISVYEEAAGWNLDASAPLARDPSVEAPRPT